MTRKLILALFIIVSPFKSYCVGEEKVELPKIEQNDKIARYKLAAKVLGHSSLSALLGYASLISLKEGLVLLKNSTLGSKNERQYRNSLIDLSASFCFGFCAYLTGKVGYAYWKNFKDKHE